MATEHRTLSKAEWEAEGTRRFGEDRSKWAFVCPVCGHVAKVEDWVRVKASDAAAFSCIGRWTGRRVGEPESRSPCNYAGGGLFKLNPVTVVDEDGSKHQLFEFAGAP
jgi:hypothetical protein